MFHVGLQICANNARGAQASGEGMNNMLVLCSNMLALCSVIQVLCSMSSPEFFALGVDGLGDERPHVTGSLGEMKDRAFGFMQYQGLAS